MLLNNSEHKMKYLVLLLYIIEPVISFIDPFSAAAVAALAALGYNYETVKELTYCRYNECCIDEYIPADISALEKQLKGQLFGQHIVIQQLIPALRGHWKKHQKSKKPLVISFHGTPGTGKNYVADFIARSLFKNGLNSQYVHKFLGRSDFPLDSHSHLYSFQLNQKVRYAVRNCPRSLFIFDEVDKMPPGVFEALTSLLDHHMHLDGTDFRQATFIFLSNTAGVQLAKQLADLMKNGVWRKETKLKDFEKILEVGAYNLKGGLHRASIIESHLIDHFIPFLPLEKEHIRQCLKEEYERYGRYSPDEKSIEYIIDNYVTFDNYSGLFATTGCKRLSKKVEIDIHS